MIALTKFSLKRPLIVFSTVMLIFVLGLIAAFQINKSFLPPITMPLIVVTIKDPGMDAPTMEQVVTRPVMKGLASEEGLENIRGSTYPGASQVILRFSANLSPYQLHNIFSDVKRSVDTLRASLPSSVSNPEIKLLSSNSSPIAWIAFKNYSGDLVSLSKTLNTLKDKIMVVPGVGGVNLAGNISSTIEVNVDPNRMSGQGVTLNMIYAAIENKYFQIPGGATQHYSLQYPLSLNPSFGGLGSIKNLIIAYRDGAPIYLNTMADVRIKSTPEQPVYWGGAPSVVMSIFAEAGGDVVKTIANVNNTLNQEKDKLLKGAQFQFFFSQSDLIQTSFVNLSMSLLLGVIFTAVVVFMYLKKINLSFATLLIIPISLSIAVLAMHAFGIGYDFPSLLGLILLVGIVIDDAIVVIENYDRYRICYPNLSRHEIILKSVESIFSSILTYAIALSLIFLSVIFMTGVAKIFFKELAFVMVPGVVGSFFVSLTVTPALCLYIDRKRQNVEPVSDQLTSEVHLGAIGRAYESLMDKLIIHRKKILLACAIFVLPVFFLVSKINADFFPPVNDGRIIAEYQMNSALSAQAVSEKTRKISLMLSRYAGVFSVNAISDQFINGQGILYIEIKKPNKTGTAEFISQLQKNFGHIDGVDITFSPPPIFTGAPAQSLQFLLLGNNFERLYGEARSLARFLQQYPQLGIFSIDTPSFQSVYQLEIDDVLAAQFGLPPKDVAQMVSLFGGGILAGHVFYDNQRYDIKLYPQDRILSRPQDLEKIYAFNQAGQLIKMNNVARLELKQAPLIIYSSLNGYQITFSSTPLISQSAAEKLVKKIVPGQVSSNTGFKIVGMSSFLNNALKSVVIAMAISTLLLYFLLVVQFNSLVLPLILLVAQPLGICAALYMLIITGIGINLYSLIGLFLLIGIVTKNSILLITLINQLHAEGKSIVEAVRVACPQRLRPISMTSLTIILSMVPVLFLHDANHASEVSLGLTIIVGVVCSTVLTLVFLPVLYLSLTEGKEKPI